MYPLPPATVLRDAVSEGPRKIQMSEPRACQEARCALGRAPPSAGRGGINVHADARPKMGRGDFSVLPFGGSQYAVCENGDVPRFNAKGGALPGDSLCLFLFRGDGLRGFF